VPLTITTKKTQPSTLARTPCPYCQTGFAFYPCINVSFYQVNTFLFQFPLTISILQVGQHSSCGRHTVGRSNSQLYRTDKMAPLARIPPETRRAPKSDEVCRSQQSLVVHTATRATSHHHHCSILQQLHTSRFVLTTIKPCVSQCRRIQS
jgi:hypothetical protein